MSYAKNSKTYTKSGNSKVRILNPDRLNNGANPTYDDVYTIDKANALLSAQSESTASSLALKADKALSNVTGILSSAHGGTGKDMSSLLPSSGMCVPYWGQSGVQGYHYLTSSVIDSASHIATSKAVYDYLKSYLPLSGGTLTGQLTGTDIKLTGTLINSTGKALALPAVAGTIALVSDIDWANLTSIPTTLSGYGITDAYTKSAADSLLAKKANTADLGTLASLSALTPALVNAVGTISNSTTGSSASCTGNAATVTGATFGNALVGTHDANSMTSNGLYYASSNFPTTAMGNTATYGAVYCQAYNNGWVAQIGQDYHTGRLFVRGCSNYSEVWSSWTRVANYDELNWPNVTGKPTTLSGYGITDSYTKAESDSLIGTKTTMSAVGALPIYLTIGNSTKNTTLANIGTAGTLSFTLADIGASAANSLHFIGTNGSAIPTAGSGSGGSIQKGDMWKQTAALSVAVANSADGVAFNAKTGDTLIAETSSTFWLVPSGDDVEDTWRAVQVNSSALLGTGLSTGALNFASGNMTTAVGSGQTVKFNHNAIANTDLTAASRTYVNSLTFDDYGHVTAYTTGKETVADTNTYHSAWAWTNGTTAGPTASITGSASAIAVAAIPSATASISGVVTTGAQTFAGVKTFSSTISGNISGNAGGSAASLTTNAGSAAVPVYFTGGVPVAITSYSGNAATATNATNDANGKAIASTYLPLAGGTMTGTIGYNVAAGSDANVIYGTMSSNDQYRFRVSGGTAANNGSIALETAYDAGEAISVAQYSGIFVTEVRRAYLLNASGNTSFPGSVTGSSFSGAGTGLTGTASSLSIGGTAAKATADASGNTISSTYLKLAGGTLTGTLTGTTVKLTTGLQNSSGNAIALPSSAGTLALQSAVDSEASARASAITSEASSRSSGDASTLSSAKSYTDAQITNLGSILEYKGSCAYASLPTSPSTGDVWNVTDANGTYPAGTNYAWNGSAWDPLGGQFDTSNLVTLNTAQTISSNKTISASNTFTVGGSVIAASAKSIYGSSTATTDLSGRKVIFENGALFIGTAASAGLATRGICGISSTDAPTKDALYLNYDGTNTYSASRAVILQAGDNGTVYNSSTGLAQYAAVRGDMLASFPKTIPTISSLGIMTNTTAANSTTTSEVGAVYVSESHAGVTRPASADALANLVNSTMRIDLATSSMSTSKPAEDGFIMTFNWDTGAAVNSQFYIPNHINGTAQFARLSVRSRAGDQNSGNWYSWRQIPYYDEVLPLSGGTMTGDITLASGKHVIPAVSNSSNLGSTSSRFANIYVNNINGTTISAFATDSEVSSVQTALQANIDNSYPDLIDLTV